MSKIYYALSLFACFHSAEQGECEREKTFPQNVFPSRVSTFCITDSILLFANPVVAAGAEKITQQFDALFF